MGFYTPATIVEDAKRHSVVVRSIDVQASDWDCTLERCGESAGGFAVRMGLRYVKGLGEGEWQRVEAARRMKTFVSLDDFVRRTGLDEGSSERSGGGGCVSKVSAWTGATRLWDAAPPGADPQNNR